MTELAPALPGRPSPWQTGTVTGVRTETPTAKTFTLQLAEPVGYLAGQHFIVRLTAQDGYTASRSYSVASAPDDSGSIELTVEKLPDGEVSTFLHDEVMVGDELEVRGPIGGWFVWRGDTPAFLVGGGSGVVPLMAMLRLSRRLDDSPPVRLVVSVRAPANLYYSDELPGPEATIVYSREIPAGYPRPAGRMTKNDLAPLVTPAATAYVCGSAIFADAATELLIDCGVATDRIRIERFGPTG